MKKLLLGSAAVVAVLAAAPALAADMPVKAPPVAVAVQSWTGYYVGLNAGYTWSTGNVTATDVFGNPALGGGPQLGAGSAALVNGSRSVRGSFIGGAQLGYNWQFNNTVVGVETDLQGIGRSRTRFSSFTDPGFPANPINQTVSQDASWLGTLRGRAGFLATPTFLAYATGGLAYGGGSRLAISQQVIGAPAAPNVYTSAGGSKTRVGWTVGAGGEWKIGNNWSAKLEYLYYDLGRETNGVLANFNITPTLFTSNVPVSHFHDHIVRLGVNYRWGAPVVARY